ncbi:efflux RND transporter periplasmic adaptor subunit [Roseiconus lacunae]|uniref:efflux RND transporter periplasmic adaptor subunit n=1 Tax=Roseiconus lacunae TaxID=2605694 RepID=UPI001E34820D|nr:efflux RND transporter periplasmic adaptor subunit [Roseiconus lacunae]MCD0463281.1 efflux RND transporter periplasmic adaptor subunit [Roseiconus lacunae]WRQ52517.1 efflux RND transporter periplasmic adaptor subunit [Stieleria sp. HD01]
MKTLLKWLIPIAVLGGVIAAAYGPAMRYWKARNRIVWETSKVTRGDVTRYVNSTGEIRPVRSVLVGSFVSGPIVELNVDFNDEVKEGDVLARVDPRLFKAEVARSEAALATRQAELERIEAELQQAINNFDRGVKLRQKREGFLSESEMDSLTFEVKSLRAQRKVAEATILQARASLDNALANLNYCEIVAPVDGIVIDRKIDPGQTLAAQFQTPELFIVAPDLRRKVHVFASVDEADIGLVQQAKEQDRPVTFTVDAHPEIVFHGTIEQIRVSSVTNQNVVTYPVVIATENPDLKLLPGMTASISFEVDSTDDVPKIPNTALRFYPEKAEWVREKDRHLIDGSTWKNDPTADDNESADLSAGEKADRRKQRHRRHVWAVDGELLRAIEIQTGLGESGYTELRSGELSTGDLLVTGQKN